MEPNNEFPELQFKDSDFDQNLPIKKEEQNIGSSNRVIRWVINNSAGYIRTEDQAGYVILAFIGVCILVVLYVIFGTGPSEAQIAPVRKF